MGIVLAERQQRWLTKLLRLVVGDSRQRLGVSEQPRQLTQHDIDYLPPKHERPYRNLGLVGQAVKRQ